MIPLPTHYIGEQTCPGHDPIPLYNIFVDIPGRCIGSTVSLNTLHEKGYTPVEVGENGPTEAS